MVFSGGTLVQTPRDGGPWKALDPAIRAALQGAGVTEQIWNSLKGPQRADLAETARKDPTQIAPLLSSYSPAPKEQAAAASSTNYRQQLEGQGVPSSTLDLLESSGVNLADPTLRSGLIQSAQQARTGLFGLDYQTSQLPVSLGETAAEHPAEMFDPELGFIPTPGPKTTTIMQALTAPLSQGWDRGRIADLQQRLLRAGFYASQGGASDIQDQAGFATGVFDEATQAAYQRALLAAARSQTRVEDVIATYSAARVDQNTELSVLRQRTGGTYQTPAQENLALAEERSYRSALADTYFKVWGLPAPPDVITSAEKQGVNITQFEAAQKADPAWKDSPAGKQNRASVLLGLLKEFQ